MINPAQIDLGRLAEELRAHEDQWVAVSAANAIVAHGKTYIEAVRQVAAPEDVILFKVTPAAYSLAPTG